MVRRVKSLRRKIGYSHREHRSKKGRKRIKSFADYKRNKDYKLRKQKLKLKDKLI